MNIDPIPAPTNGHAPGPQTRQSAAASLVDSGPINILIVDDEPKNLTVLESILSDPDYRLVRAESADQALLALMEEEFALLILDIRMPGMTGFELAQMIKDRKKTAQVPIIFLTAYYNEDQHELEGYGTGAVDYLHKPVNPAILRSKVAVFAELQRRTRASEMANRALSAEVTERRRIEEQLREMNETLEQRVTERSEALVMTRTALNEAGERCRLLFDGSLDAIFSLGRDGRFESANPAALRLLGRTLEELKTVHFMELCASDQREAAESAVLAAKGRECFTMDTTVITATGERRDLFISGAPAIMGGEVGGVSCIAHDVTERNRLENERQRQAAESSDLHRRKDEFLAMLSHELRTPLAPMTNAVQLLGLQPESETQTQKQARGIIERQLGQLQHLVEDLLEVSRLTTGNVQLRRELVAVREIAERAVETVRPLIEQHRHEFSVSLPPEPIWLFADAARLQQVLVNLLTNAAKYTAEGGHVWLTVESENDKGMGRLGEAETKSSPTHVTLRVRDTGVGISPALLPHIFELFTQGERSLDRSEGGLGVGLALVRRLTDLHEGMVEVHSAVGQGSEFVVRLPLPLSPIEAPLPTSPETESWQPVTRLLRVLVVDDNEDTLSSFTMLLKMLDYDVQTALDGPTAVQLALEYQPDVVFLDIGLPGLNGYEVAKRLRLKPEFNDVVLVALTGYGQDSDRQTAVQAGFNHHLVKPASPAQLQRILATVSEQVTQ